MQTYDEIPKLKRTAKTGERRGKALPRRAQDLSKEELLRTLKKKKECNAKALKIVEGLLEAVIDKTWFIEVLQHINQSHFQDAVEERAITKLCGYPLCSNGLKDIPSQQYRISTRQNKVFDITERKNFCSNRCFHASKFVKDQLLTSPLWLRDIEETPQFMLMPENKPSCASGPGDEVDVSTERVSRAEVEKIINDRPSLLKQTSETSKTAPSISPSCEALAKALDNLEIASKLPRPKIPAVPKPESHFQMRKSSSKAKELPEEKTSKSDEQNLVGGSSDRKTAEEINDFVNKEFEDHHKFTENKYLESPSQSASNQTCKKDDMIVLSDNSQTVSYVEMFPIDESAALNTPKATPDLSVNETGVSKLKDTLASNATLVEDALKISIPENVKAPVIRESVVAECRKTAPENIVKVEKPTGTSLSEGSCQTESEQAAFVEQNPVEKRVIEEEKCACIPVEDTGSDIAAPVKEPKETFLHLQNNVAHPSAKKGDGKPKAKSKIRKKHSNASDDVNPMVMYVETCVQEWFTMETMCFLFGESLLKEMLEQKGESIREHYKALDSLTWDPEKHERFLAICKRLSLLEMTEKSYDEQVSKADQQSHRKPLPDYKALKEESEKMHLKVNAFYEGKMESGHKVPFSEDTNTEKSEEEDNPSVLPLVHLHGQRALRKKIVLDGLGRVLPDFLRTFGLRSSELTSSLRGLVNTFALSPNNITFKPHQWSLLGLIVIKLLSIREFRLKSLLETEQSSTYLTLMLMSYNLEPGYLDRLLMWLTDIDQLLSKSRSDNDKQ